MSKMTHRWPATDYWIKQEDGWWQVREHGVESPLVQMRRRAEAVAYIRMLDAGLMFPAIIAALSRPRSKKTGAGKKFYATLEKLAAESRHQRHTLSARWGIRVMPGFCAAIMRGEMPRLIATGEPPTVGDEWVIERDDEGKPRISIEATSIHENVENKSFHVGYRILEPKAFRNAAPRPARTKLPKGAEQVQERLAVGDPVKSRTKRANSRLHQVLKEASHQGHSEVALAAFETFLDDFEADMQAVYEHPPKPPGLIA